MSEQDLTMEERRCLQMWFRQAIARLEQEEVTAQFIQVKAADEQKSDTHRLPVVKRRNRRAKVFTHGRELVY